LQELTLDQTAECEDELNAQNTTWSHPLVGLGIGFDALVPVAELAVHGTYIVQLRQLNGSLRWG
jgi:hypothetical protein